MTILDRVLIAAFVVLLFFLVDSWVEQSFPEPIMVVDTLTVDVCALPDVEWVRWWDFDSTSKLHGKVVYEAIGPVSQAYMNSLRWGR